MTTTKLLTAALASALVAGTASAASSLGLSGTTLLNGNGEEFGVSVVAGQAQVRTGNSQGGNYVALGDGTLLDWHVATGANGDDPYVGASVTNGGHTYFDVPTSNEVLYSPQNWMQVYTANDITADTTTFDNAEIQSGTIPMTGSYNFPLIGNLDISNLSGGSFYAIFGGYRSTSTITLTMSGAGQTDIVEVQTNPSSIDNQAFLYDFTFDNSDGLYDNIEYQVQSSTNGGRRRYGGVFVDGTVVIPEPGSLALLSLGGLLVARRRRG